MCIDDEEDLLSLLEFNLSNAFFDYEIIGCLNTKIARRFIENENIALMLMDRNLLIEDGINFIKDIKYLGYDIPVIFLSALNLPQDLIKGLSVGDDYITKPFNIEELIARIKAVLRRYIKNDSEILSYKNISLNIKQKVLSINNKLINLSSLEVRLMMCFIKNSRNVLSREFLIEHAWEEGSQEGGVNVAIKRLRKKLQDDNIIKSIRGEGYKLC